MKFPYFQLILWPSLVESFISEKSYPVFQFIIFFSSASSISLSESILFKLMKWGLYFRISNTKYIVIYATFELFDNFLHTLWKNFDEIAWIEKKLWPVDVLPMLERIRISKIIPINYLFFWWSVTKNLAKTETVRQIIHE